MDKVVADEIIGKELESLRKLPYSSLSALIGKPVTRTTAGRDGREYDIEVQVLWDDRPDEGLRVIVAVSDGGWRAMLPRSGSVVLARSDD